MKAQRLLSWSEAVWGDEESTIAHRFQTEMEILRRRGVMFGRRTRQGGDHLNDRSMFWPFRCSIINHRLMHCAILLAVQFLFLWKPSTRKLHRRPCIPPQVGAFGQDRRGTQVSKQCGAAFVFQPFHSKCCRIPIYARCFPLPFYAASLFPFMLLTCSLFPETPSLQGDQSSGSLHFAGSAGCGGGLPGHLARVARALLMLIIRKPSSSPAPVPPRGPVRISARVLHLRRAWSRECQRCVGVGGKEGTKTNLQGVL
jgi:hypothetical protein